MNQLCVFTANLACMVIPKKDSLAQSSEVKRLASLFVSLFE